MSVSTDAFKGDEKAPDTARDCELQPNYFVDDSLKPQHSIIEGEVEDLDEATLYLREHNITTEYTAELLEDKIANKRVSRKVDLLLLPLLCGTYFLQYIDKQALSYSAVFDLFETTGITSEQYSWLGSIFYFAYLVAEWPSAYLAQHFPVGRVVSGYCFCWGSIMLLTVATKSFAGFAALRFLLGIFESVVTPAFMMIVSMWYLSKQQPARAGIFYCFNGVGSATGGILFYGVGFAKSFSFTTEEKALLIARAAKNRTGVYNRKIKLPQVWEAMQDAQIWILFLFVLLNEIINGGMASFGKLIIKNVAGGDPLRTTLYGIPQGFAQVFWVFTGPFLASRLPNARTYIMALYLCPTVIGTTLIWKLPRTNLGGSLAGYYMLGSYVGSLVIALQLPASNVGGYTKRTTGTAVVFMAYCIGNIIGRF
ncbi:MFS general substrate transporter [Pyrenophora tritici-repentis]|nr:MFS general substrate transporter [Pyrenophora tritici-repentis]KAI0586866.1 MFS general substrate transporter [Pyrenophora tritici-repentis]KAI0606193.1 MFS general substrate transporter [Pyrenophora tritici-repentis]KAI0618371.1 MFS general substrate transporter [Pyrenophora tritici-repentis]KAI1525508.1 UhpC Sugar phosphate permease [Pyrenophora tritici-repentis]